MKSLSTEHIVSSDQHEPHSTFTDINSHWLQRWESGDTGWHHQEFNPHLLSCWGGLQAPPGCTVLVPLCGKSRDMVWLAEQGHSVIGIELSPLAVAAFFEENGLTPAREVQDDFDVWQAGPYRILCGDIFRLQPQHVAGVQALYDRASLVAFNPEQRRNYAALLRNLLGADCRMLLVAMDYPQAEMQGPPHAVNQAEVETLFGQTFSVELLDSLDLLAASDRYADRGLSRLWEQVYRLQRR
jgi:thiopurine S-methyltransferase